MGKYNFANKKLENLANEIHDNLQKADKLLQEEKHERSIA